MLFTVFSLLELFSATKLLFRWRKKTYLELRPLFRLQIFSVFKCCDIQGSRLIGYLWVSLIIGQSECLVFYFFLHWINPLLLHWKVKWSLIKVMKSGKWSATRKALNWWTISPYLPLKMVRDQCGEYAYRSNDLGYLESINFNQNWMSYLNDHINVLTTKITLFS